jgi:hypothetical protein
MASRNKSIFRNCWISMPFPVKTTTSSPDAMVCMDIDSVAHRFRAAQLTACEESVSNRNSSKICGKPFSAREESLCAAQRIRLSLQRETIYLQSHLLRQFAICGSSADYLSIQYCLFTLSTNTRLAYGWSSGTFDISILSRRRETWSGTPSG